MSVAEIKKAVAALPEQERADLAVWLLELLPEPSFGDEHEGDAGLAEAERRREELEAGRVKPISGEQFWAEVDRKRSQWK
jgi:Putative addiction module component